VRRRGGGVLLSTLDWAIIETGRIRNSVGSRAVRIDAAFDRYDQASLRK